MNNYSRIAKAIEFIKLNFKAQPDLNEIAEKVNLSPFHFQRMFTDWAGVSPKKFLQYLSVEYAKNRLREQATLSDAAFETGLSGTSRLHDLFISIEGMTPGEYKNGGQELSINYSFADTPFGNIIVASTAKGICWLAFADDREHALADLKVQFANAEYHPKMDEVQQNALSIFNQDWSRPNQLKLHLKGTSFQLKVWEALLKIPMGGLTTYSGICSRIENPNASRAVGSAIGSNPVAFLIPCHRVIRSTGEFGQYHWGSTRKNLIIGWEASRTINETEQSAGQEH